jgi:hypothetical protein
MGYVDKGTSHADGSTSAYGRRVTGSTMSPIQKFYSCCTGICCLGFILIIVGAMSLTASLTDTRGNKMVKFETAMTAWNADAQTTGPQKQFQNLKPTVSQPGGISAVSMGDATPITVTPANYGEQSFNDHKNTKSKTNTPDTLKDYKYEKTVTGLNLGNEYAALEVKFSSALPTPAPASPTAPPTAYSAPTPAPPTANNGAGGYPTAAPNPTPAPPPATAGGAQALVVPNVGVRTTKEEFGLCSYYDEDYQHPMLVAGLGCQQGYGKMCPETSASGRDMRYQKCGPTCVEQDQCQAIGSGPDANMCCPTDVTTQTYMQTRMAYYGYTGAAVAVTVPTTVSKYRFTYDANDGTCTDWDDCRCVGPDGLTFGNSKSSGTMFGNNGFLAGNQWYPYSGATTGTYAVPTTGTGAFGSNTNPYFSAYNNAQKAAMCRYILESWKGRRIAGDIKYQCFAATGFPKKRCDNYCQNEKKGLYTPRQLKSVTNFVNTMSTTAYTMYPPFGMAPVTVQVPQVVRTFYTTYFQTPPSCEHKSKLTNVAINTDSSGSSITYKKGPRTQVEYSGGSFPSTTQLTVTVNSPSDGPIAQMKAITGCSKGTTSKKCFGLTQAENASNGMMFLGLGIVLMIIPIVTMALVVKGVVAVFK